MHRWRGIKWENNTAVRAYTRDYLESIYEQEEWAFTLNIY